MPKSRNRNTKRPQNNKPNPSKKQNTLALARSVVPKSMARTRSDIQVWKRATQMFQSPDNPKSFPIYNLYQDMMLDARLTSQVENRKQKTLATSFSIKNQAKKVDETLTELLTNSGFTTEIIAHILDTLYYGYTVLEFDRMEDETTVALLPRQNIIPTKALFIKDYAEDKGITITDTPEYGSWLVDFGKKGDLGLLNKVIPHVIYKRFAQSCWSELCEIYGIPPRVMHTNTQDRNALNRAEKMMTDVGAAAWFIIDDTEKFEFAQTTATSGDVYNNLINLCNNEISMLLSGAIIGQDSKFGTKGKEETAADTLQDLVNADKKIVAQIFNQKIIPALYRIGVLPSDQLIFEFDKVDDLTQLWTRTKEILPYKNIDDQWIKDKFGVEVTGDRTATNNGNQLSINTNDFLDV